MYSRVRLIQTVPKTSRVVLQDSYEMQDELEELHEVPDQPSNAPSVDNFYDAPGLRDSVAAQDDLERSVGPTSTSLPEVRINLHPTERLIEAMEQLREVILDNTNVQQKQRRRGARTGGGGPGGGGPPNYKSNGTVNLKDERLKIRRDKKLFPIRE
ncbi:hypothetical protein CAPTEDRAFT_215264 [Capitella teleta]|uniref:Uncharacterized protein n=1 Tax=Capitella teleta TaxID=283909 RepID=R7VKL6_CAPTE|nr:hypothetical protein CAPTEDRAFT_215264 [Capitella teleta]|eukprot:ELU17486.1 hypothetical protein CAPTEDRAFT_215264 [Capitella teleta]